MNLTKITNRQPSSLNDNEGKELINELNGYALQHSEVDFEQLIQALPTAVYTCDKNGYINLFNKAAVELFGRLPEPGKDRWCCSWKIYNIDGIAADVENCPMAEAMKYNKIISGAELIIERPDGSRRTVVPYPQPLYNQNGKITGGINVIIDISERKQYELALKESERRYRHLVQGLPAALYTCDKDGFITLFNQAAVELWGRKPEIGKDLWCGSWKIYKKDGVTYLPLDECPMAVALKSGKKVVGEEIIVEQPNGNRKYILPHPEPIFDSDGNIAGAVNMLVDITEQKNSERALRESDEWLHQATDGAELGTFHWDLPMDNFVFSKRLANIFGFENEQEITHQFLIDAIHPEDLFIRNKAFEESLVTGMLFYEVRIILPDNFSKWIRVNGKILFGDNGKPTKLNGIVMDITDQKMANEKLEKIVEERTKELTLSNALLKKSNNELEQFAYIASHDLQEPLRKIQTFLELIEGNLDDNEVRQKYFGKIESSAIRMSQLINGVLNFSRLAMVNDKLEKVNLNSILSSVKEDFELLIDEKKATIEAGPLPIVWGNTMQLSQLVSNLINNSLKFCDKEPVITISYCTATEEILKKHALSNAGNPYLHFTFTDNGIGFDQQYAEQIFSIFQRLNERGSYSGTGIGLALCKKIVDNHKGIIWAEGAAGKGAAFHFLLPV